MSKTVLLCISAIVLTALLATVIMHIVDTRTYCSLHVPLACADPRIETEGFIFNIGNTGEEQITIRDISVTRSGQQECRFPRIGQVDEVQPNRAITYIISPDHPDGKCLMGEMLPGKSYRFEIKVDYTIEGKNFTARGAGRTQVSNTTIIA